MTCYYFQLSDTEKVSLVFPDEKYADDLFTIIDKERDRLMAFLPWASQMINVSDEEKFLRYAKEKMQKQELFLLIILVNQQAVGMIDFHNFNQITKQAEVGYWLSEKYEKRGIMSKSLRWLMAYGFNSLKLKKIEIQVDKKNNNSLKIPRRLGFSEDKIIKNFTYYNGLHHDFVIFSKTK